MKILYTRAHDGGLNVIHAASQLDVEKVHGPLTHKAYRTRMWQRLVPADAINPIEIDDSYVLPNREFRDAWKQEGARVGHDLVKAKAMQLERVRAKRDLAMVEADKMQSRALDLEDAAEVLKVKALKVKLRNITEPLKALVPKSIEDIISHMPEF